MNEFEICTAACEYIYLFELKNTLQLYTNSVRLFSMWLKWAEAAILPLCAWIMLYYTPSYLKLVENFSVVEGLWELWKSGMLIVRLLD